MPGRKKSIIEEIPRSFQPPYSGRKKKKGLWGGGNYLARSKERVGDFSVGKKIVVTSVNGRGFELPDMATFTGERKNGSRRGGDNLLAYSGEKNVRS